MKTTPVTGADIARSVWAVPPLSRSGEEQLCATENARLCRHIENGGVSTLLYGGNANIYAATAMLFEAFVDQAPDWVADETWLIPSVGPDWGKLMDQARLLSRADFPAAMTLPVTTPHDKTGIERAIRDFSQSAGIPVIVYVKTAGYLPPDRFEALFADGVVAAIKYAVEAEDPRRDSYLEALLNAVPANRVVSGIGEVAAIPHLDSYRIAGFTAGAVCIAPRRSMAVLRALQAGDAAEAERLCEPIQPMEDLRATHGPIPVIHEAVTQSRIADMRRILPPISGVADDVRGRIAAAVLALLDAEEEFQEAAA